MYAVDTDDEYSRLVQAVYDKVILESSKVLLNSKRFSIHILKLADDPTYQEIADALLEVCDMIDFLVKHRGLEEHAWTCAKARDYAKFVADVAKAIEACDEVELKRLTEEMDKGSFL
ncbi:PH domain-containing protein [Endozoicomonas euniceicola]|uniref:Uncharacterized protein n=1 Tax=Endozoicomonas euniceicola TaxID=1234143 RepID=A0ABY6GNF8_9GAMM|nr:hypothetical protein [Endozoicomonas euniceicola]UYM14243.1 hypothetical protein NX720_15200 [Endozoicomonas euniceicola]